MNPATSAVFCIEAMRDMARTFIFRNESTRNASFGITEQALAESTDSAVDAALVHQPAVR